MSVGRVVALEGASASGKTTIARRLGPALDALVLPEAYVGLRPLPSLTFASDRDLERLETRLLEAEARRWQEATRVAASGRVVVLDTGPFGPLTYTYGLVQERMAPDRVLRTLLRRARALTRSGHLGLPSISIYLDVPAAERARRARRTPGAHPPELVDRHRRVALWERRLLLGPRREDLRIRRLRVVTGTRVPEVVRRVRDLLLTLHEAPDPRSSVGQARVLSLLHALWPAQPPRRPTAPPS